MSEPEFNFYKSPTLPAVSTRGTFYVIGENDSEDPLQLYIGLAGGAYKAVGSVAAGGATPIFHTQNSASDTWIINHNTGVRPAVEVYDDSWSEVGAEVTHTSDNQVRILFSSPVTGFARLT